MRPGDVKLGNGLRQRIASFKVDGGPLPITNNAAALDCLIEQLVESVRRNKYIEAIKSRPISAARLDPHSPLFDPYRAAVLLMRRQEVEEAFWLVFQATHFGKHGKDGWQLYRDVYGRLGARPVWSWAKIALDFAEFEAWFDSNLSELRARGNRFSNHRKYQRLANTKRVFRSYLDWIMSRGGHQKTVDHAVQVNGNGPPRAVFDHLYSEMGAVYQFGRLGRFDFLCMVGKLGLAPVEPGSTYLVGATGPYAGARLLLGNRSKKECDMLLTELDDVLQVGMQAIEDALCNWQKSPTQFVAFRG